MNDLKTMFSCVELDLPLAIPPRATLESTKLIMRSRACPETALCFNSDLTARASCKLMCELQWNLYFLEHLHGSAETICWMCSWGRCMCVGCNCWENRLQSSRTLSPLYSATLYRSRAIGGGTVQWVPPPFNGVASVVDNKLLTGQRALDIAHGSNRHAKWSSSFTR